MSDYSAEKVESEMHDRELGFDLESVEARVRARLALELKTSETWAHLSPQVFQTPYAELRRIVLEADSESSASTWVDLGAGYGRLGIVLAELRPNARFIGIESVPERVEEGRRVYQRLGIASARLECADLATAVVPDASIYFIYDFGRREEIDRVLETLRSIAQRAPITVIGRGRAIRDAIERNHPWLCAVIPPRHSAHSSIYRSS